MSSSSSEEGRSDPLTFWSRPVSPFGRFVVTRLERLFTCVQPSDPSLVRLRIQGWQGPDRCPRSFGRRITPSPVRVGTPGHHRVRGGIATSFTTLLDRPCGRMHNVCVRPLVAPGLLRGLRRRGARARQAIPLSRSVHVLARRGCPVRPLERPRRPPFTGRKVPMAAQFCHREPVTPRWTWWSGSPL
jgi:hypothetical protein